MPLTSDTDFHAYVAEPVYPCFVPWLDQRPLINATGFNENECHVNLTMLDLSDEELQRVIIRPAKLCFNSQQ